MKFVDTPEAKGERVPLGWRRDFNGRAQYHDGPNKPNGDGWEPVFSKPSKESK